MGSNGNRSHLRIVGFEDDASSKGFMVFAGAPPRKLAVSRTPENDHLFMYNDAHERFEVLRYGSALIVNALKLFEPTPGGPVNNQRRFALFDTGGNFHNNLFLREPLYPRDTDTGIPHVKHIAVFDKGLEDVEGSLAIAIDDIYMLSLAKPPTAKT